MWRWPDSKEEGNHRDTEAQGRHRKGQNVLEEWNAVERRRCLARDVASRTWHRSHCDDPLTPYSSPLIPYSNQSAFSYIR